VRNLIEVVPVSAAGAEAWLAEVKVVTLCALVAWSADGEHMAAITCDVSVRGRNQLHLTHQPGPVRLLAKVN
jgi:hypothetical protein